MRKLLIREDFKSDTEKKDPLKNNAKAYISWLERRLIQTQDSYRKACDALKLTCINKYK